MKSNSFACDVLEIGREGLAFAAPITLTLNSGELLVIHGANGAGKSTLLKTIAGLLRPVGGSFRVDPADAPILYIGHQHGMVAGMSVADNAAFWARMHGAPELAAAAMHYFDLDDYAESLVETLSAGWQQRVALTRLITIPSALWLLDEPSANLDKEGVALLQSLLQSRLEQGGIVLMTSHAALQGPSVRTLTLGQPESHASEDIHA